MNSNPCLISSVCGNTDPKISVPMIASVLKSHTRMGNSVCSPKNETTQSEHPEMSIRDPLAPPSVRSGYFAHGGSNLPKALVKGS